MPLSALASARLKAFLVCRKAACVSNFPVDGELAPSSKNAMKTPHISKVGIEAEQVIDGSGRILSLEQLSTLADRLLWVTPKVFIMPPHQYVVEAKLRSQEEREAFESLRDACAHHPKRWKAFFRAYRTKGNYLEIGDHRYWYSQIGAARMMNRSDRKSELKNIRRGEGERAVKNWGGCAYAWRWEYGLACENIQSYCNLVVFQASLTGRDGSIIRYAAMVPRVALSEWCAIRKDHPISGNIEEDIRRLLQGVEAVSGVSPSRSKQATCSDEEASLRAVWMHQRDMGVSRVATDLRLFSTAPRLEIERILPLETDRNYLVQLGVTPV